MKSGNPLAKPVRRPNGNPIIWLVPCLLFLVTCKPDTADKKEAGRREIAVDSTFDPVRWQVREGDNYPYRERMYRQLLYSDTLRQRSKSEILRLLGAPDRTGEGHIYYQLRGTQVGPVLFFSKFLVFKFTEADSVEWIKVHDARPNG